MGKIIFFIIGFLAFLVVSCRENELTKRFDQVTFFRKVDSFRDIGLFLCIIN